MAVQEKEAGSVEMAGKGRTTIHCLSDPRITNHDPRPFRSPNHDPRSTAFPIPESRITIHGLIYSIFRYSIFNHNSVLNNCAYIPANFAPTGLFFS